MGALLTLTAAALLCWWSLSGVDWATLPDAVRRAHPGLVVAAVAGYTVAFCVLDTAAFTLVYRKHLAAAVPVRHVATIVCGKQLLGVVFSPLTKLVATLYFHRRWRVPVLRTLGATEVLTVADTIVLVGLVVVGTGTVDGMPAGASVLAALMALALALFLLWAWLPAARGVLPRLRRNAFLSVLVQTSPAQMLAQLGLRSCLVLAMAASWWSLLLANGVDLDFGRLVQFCSVFLVVVQLPVSVAGYGGPQGACVLLLSDAWGLMSREDAAVLSLLWSTAYLVSRVVIGFLFAVPAVRLLRVDEKGSGRAEHDQARTG
ncbi:Lysylphosphatidylglycerol synthase TM region [Lentzea fradiae]|uniref:Lysylphosphatidylglycerol synthase TM region n=1 Tax=Lentzea fradiae TaxID=200378 RepID=A0A1G7UWI7_9PSEU|nr:lysylphosphatidylglycerol synthase domain-containing protein [Lentzea fradiae]SDG51100.1 Lysylphosphatidylglycerol synthase TM region [Lentzea fradiae]